MGARLPPAHRQQLAGRLGELGTAFSENQEAKGFQQVLNVRGQARLCQRAVHAADHLEPDARRCRCTRGREEDENEDEQKAVHPAVPSDQVQSALRPIDERKSIKATSDFSTLTLDALERADGARDRHAMSATSGSANSSSENSYGSLDRINEIDRAHIMINWMASDHQKLDKKNMSASL